jgi:hypothetical protein
MKIRIRISRRVSSRQARSSLVGPSGVATQKECVNRTRMTRIRRIIADEAKKISVNQLYPRHPRSINPYADMKTALPQPRFEDAAFEVCHWSLQEIGSVNPQ